MRHFLLGLSLTLVLLGCERRAAPTPTAGVPGTRVCEVPLHNPAGIAGTTQIRNVCSNHTGAPLLIKKVLCKTQKGSLFFWPRLSGRKPASILPDSLVCNQDWQGWVLSEPVRLDSFAVGGATCAGACTIDYHLQHVSGVQDVVLTIVLTPQ